MRKIIGAAALAFLFSLSAYGQGGNIPNTVIQSYVGAPSGVCTAIMVATNVSNGDFYDCLTGSWHKVTGAGGSGCTTSGTAGQILADDGAGGCTSLTTSGTGNGIRGTSPTIVTPTIASFTNATHNHQAAVGGGTLAEAALALTDVTTNNATTSAHGFAPKGDGNAAHFLTGTLAWATPAGGGSGCNPAGAAGVVQASNGSGACQDTLATDNGTSLTYTGTGGIVANSGITAGTGGSVAGYVKIPQGTANGHATANNIVVEAPAAVTAYEMVLPGTSATGFMLGTDASNVNTVSFVGSSGTGNVVRVTSATLVTPTLGAATATSVNKMAITAPASSSTLAVADGKTLTASNTLTFTGTDSSSVAFGAGGTVTYTIASGTSALGTSAIASGACATVVTTSATGTAATDNIMSDFNADPTAVTGYSPSANGMLTIIKYPTTNNVNYKVCNNTSSSITPGAITLNWRVVR